MTRPFVFTNDPPARVEGPLVLQFVGFEERGGIQFQRSHGELAEDGDYMPVINATLPRIAWHVEKVKVFLPSAIREICRAVRKAGRS